jgi:hypothetical protein
VNPLSLVSGAIVHPARTLGAVASTTIDVASLGLRTTARVVGWAAGGVVDTPSAPASVPTSLRPTDVAVPVDTSRDERTAPEETPVTTTPVKKAAASKTAARKTASKKAPAKKAASKKAAVVAPALGISEAEALDVELDQISTEPVVDQGTVNAVASEAEMMARAADPDKG